VPDYADQTSTMASTRSPSAHMSRGRRRSPRSPPMSEATENTPQAAAVDGDGDVVAATVKKRPRRPPSRHRTEEPDAPAAPAAKSDSRLENAFGLIKQAVGRIGIDEEPAPQEEEKPVSEDAEPPRPSFPLPHSM